jgi:hypothetical protein
MKLLDVTAVVVTRSGAEYKEPRMDAYGRVVTASGEAKRPDQLVTSDELVMDPVAIGKVINSALDRPDDKLTAEERRKRWTLSVRIEDAMRANKPLEFERDDETRITAAADSLTNNLFVGRIYEALDAATAPSKLKVVE